MTSLLSEIGGLDTQVSVTDEIDSNLSMFELQKLFFDGEKSISFRSSVLHRLWTLNPEICLESTNKICSMFSFSKTSVFRKLLSYIVTESDNDISIRTECARVLYDDNKENGYQCFLCICNDKRAHSLSTPIRIDIIRTLMETDKHYNETLKLFIQILTDKKLPCEYRYKTLLSIQRDTTRSCIPKYIDEAYFTFVECNDITTNFRILASQYLLQKPGYPLKSKVEDIIIGFATDTALDYNIRADASDLLIRCGTPRGKIVGKEIITLLGRDNVGKNLNVYTNLQNVHDENIDASIESILLQISSIKCKEKDGKFIDLSFIWSEIETMTSRLSQEDRDKINSSLLRISIDQQIYSGSQTLKSVFCKVWQIIGEHTERDSLYIRMIDELIDMADTCSSGHLSRIVNILSGFTVNGNIVSINIGWEKQLQSNLVARLNARIKLVDDEEKKYAILEEMMTPGGLDTKPKLSEFFRTNLLNIRDELYSEFVGEKHISDEQFEEYFRNAIEFFETG
jgi:hypothetical protein